MAIERVSPEIDCGRFPIKRCTGDRVVVEADVFTDGNDLVAGRLRHRPRGRRVWHEVPLRPLDNDRWRASFSVDAVGRWEYTLVAWVDRFGTWRRDLVRRRRAGHDVSLDLESGAAIIDAAAERAPDPPTARRLAERAAALRDTTASLDARVDLARSDELAGLVARIPDRASATVYPHVLEVVVDRRLACFGAWYEMFPRSASAEPGRHGTLRDVERLLPYVAGMGFDVLYLPPVHPIGETNRKGRNNTPRASRSDVGSPWAIGGDAGGHDAVHPELGTLADFRRLVRAAAEHDLEIALDLAFQASPDHPWVREHPEWFRHRPDGTIRHAENPPKTYEDIYPFDFESDAWRELWTALKGVVDFWIG
ncbi:MAG: maltotransferase domain-containing protein, partial [Gemmatimonadota bacterium]